MIIMQWISSLQAMILSFDSSRGVIDTYVRKLDQTEYPNVPVSLIPWVLLVIQVALYVLLFTFLILGIRHFWKAYKEQR